MNRHQVEALTRTNSLQNCTACSSDRSLARPVRNAKLCGSVLAQSQTCSDGMALVRLEREQGNQSLCFSSRPFVLCGLPVRPLAPGQLIMSGGTATSSFRSTVPRVRCSLWPRLDCADFSRTLAVLQKSQTIWFRSASEIWARNRPSAAAVSTPPPAGRRIATVTDCCAR